MYRYTFIVLAFCSFLISFQSRAQCEEWVTPSKITTELNKVLQDPKYGLKKDFGGQQKDAAPDFIEALQDLEEFLYREQSVLFDPAEEPARLIIEKYYLDLLVKYWATSPFAQEIELRLVTIPADLGKNGVPLFNSIPAGHQGIIFKLKTNNPKTPFGQHLQKVEKELDYPIIFPPAYFLTGAGANGALNEGGKLQLPHFDVGPKILKDILLAKDVVTIDQHPIWSHELFHGKILKDSQEGKFSVLTGFVNGPASFHLDENYATIITVRAYLQQLHQVIGPNNLTRDQKILLLKSLITDLSQNLSVLTEYLKNSLLTNTAALMALQKYLGFIREQHGCVFQKIYPFTQDPGRIVYQFAIMKGLVPSKVVLDGFEMLRDEYAYFFPRKLFNGYFREDGKQPAEFYSLLHEILLQQHDYLKSLTPEITKFARAWLDLFPADMKDEDFIDSAFLKKLAGISFPAEAKIKLPYLKLRPQEQIVPIAVGEASGDLLFQISQALDRFGPLKDLLTKN